MKRTFKFALVIALALLLARTGYMATLMLRDILYSDF
jgi:hypothetical protein